MAFLILKRSCDTTHAFMIVLHHTRVQNLQSKTLSRFKLNLNN